MSTVSKRDEPSKIAPVGRPLNVPIHISTVMTPTRPPVKDRGVRLGSPRTPTPISGHTGAKDPGFKERTPTPFGSQPWREPVRVCVFVVCAPRSLVSLLGRVPSVCPTVPSPPEVGPGVLGTSRNRYGHPSFPTITSIRSRRPTMDDRGIFGSPFPCPFQLRTPPFHSFLVRDVSSTLFFPITQNLPSHVIETHPHPV